MYGRLLHRALACFLATLQLSSKSIAIAHNSSLCESSSAREASLPTRSACCEMAVAIISNSAINWSLDSPMLVICGKFFQPLFNHLTAAKPGGAGILVDFIRMIHVGKKAIPQRDCRKFGFKLRHFTFHTQSLYIRSRRGVKVLAVEKPILLFPNTPDFLVGRALEKELRSVR